MKFILAIDQGTTNSRAIIFDRQGSILSQHEIPLSQYFPQEGWVEQRPEEIFKNSITCCIEAIKKAHLNTKDIAAIGISNQRETTIIWDKKTGNTLYPAIVWQDRRTHAICTELKKFELLIKQKTGLLLDPYFSATKIHWILNHVPQAREKAERGDLLFGTVDTYLLWKLTNGKTHATDASNASRTLLFNIHTQQWDPELLKIFNIPQSLLPIVLDNAAFFGETDKTIFGILIPITGMAGDQQAATIGQACFHPGMIKTTYGTGGFLLLNTGKQAVQSKHQLLTTIAYRLNGLTTYGLEGSIFSAGVTIKWLRDQLKLIQTAAETEQLAQQIPNTEGVYFVPAFTGLGAPYWNPHARAALLGITRNTNISHIARAALESVAYQTRDLFSAMHADSKMKLTHLRVDGGMAANHWLLQFLADMLDIPVQRPTCIETSALGAAFLAGLQIGFYSSLEDIEKLWQIQLEFQPKMQTKQREQLYAGWQRAVQKVLI